MFFVHRQTSFSPHSQQVSTITRFSLFLKKVRHEVKTSGPRERTIDVVRKDHQKSNVDS